MKPLFNLALILFSLQSYGQLKPIINNETIDYRIIKTPVKLLDSNKVELSKTFINVFLTDSVRDELMCFSYKEWTTLLLNKNTDWAANLCLHDIFKKNAALCRLEMSREKWIDCCNIVDIKYWKANLRRLIANNKATNNHR